MIHFFRVVVEEVTSRYRRQRILEQYRAAIFALNVGDLSLMQSVADQSVGDAWKALAEAYTSGVNTAHDETTALAAFYNATKSKTWFNNMHMYCAREYDRRRFLGIGTTPDYALLLDEWTAYSFTGNEREPELAWIRACGPVELRNEVEAWEWLSLWQARRGGRSSPTLPSSSTAEIRQNLERSLPLALRATIDARAKKQAYDEFVYMR